MYKIIDVNTGDKCPLCKNGRIALASSFCGHAELDQEPYTNGVIEGDQEEIDLNDIISFSMRVCDNCKEIFSIDIQNDFRKEVKE